MLILILTLSACKTKSYKTCITFNELPVMPIGGIPVAKEIKILCSKNKKRCYNLNIWLNELHTFAEHYSAIKED